MWTPTWPGTKPDATPRRSDADDSEIHRKLDTVLRQHEQMARMLQATMQRLGMTGSASDCNTCCGCTLAASADASHPPGGRPAGDGAEAARMSSLWSTTHRNDRYSSQEPPGTYATPEELPLLVAEIDGAQQRAAPYIDPWAKPSLNMQMSSKELERQSLQEVDDDAQAAQRHDSSAKKLSYGSSRSSETEARAPKHEHTVKDRSSITQVVPRSIGSPSRAAARSRQRSGSASA